jgi:trans-aconitate 2-methyltransferase
VADVWDPDRYARFDAARSQPFYDLLALVDARPGGRVADLGCGTGELTQRLHEHVGAAETVGVDSSQAMLAKAESRAGGGLHFVLEDIASWHPSKMYDVVFTNAALQWLPDHRELLDRLAGTLAPHGQLAVQIPANFDHASHATARDVAREQPFRAALGGFEGMSDVPAPERYATILHDLGLARIHVRLQVYVHVLDGPESVVSWVEGTLLNDYRRRMEADLFDRFVERYRALLLDRLPDRRPFPYTFKRILFRAVRPS